MRDFENQMKILKQSNEYGLATMRERAALEAQLIAMQKGDLSWRQMSKSPGNPYDAGGLDAGDIISGVLGAAGAGLGYQNRALVGKGLGTASQYLANEGSFGNIANKGLQAASTGVKQGTANVFNKLSPKVGNGVLQKILQGAGAGAMDASIGMANLGSAVAGKGSTALASKVLGGAGARAAGKVGGALIVGVPGFLIGTALGEVIGKMLDSDDENERAKAQYMLDQYR
jgi:hypothetical protein